ncbi:MAG: DUF1501 domain-containing protein [Actinobacteria bacterium]|uniref:Unannotated protein n=1 Tax=freshwater metagenome TaxID=449393 RepID=A0A6J7K8L9_9ZZZZ|nr:DUF1501 domain-containing protein [Actinomycetota bacterium]
MANKDLSTSADAAEATVLSGTVNRRRFIAGAGVAAGSLAATAYLSPSLLVGSASAASLPFTQSAASPVRAARVAKPTNNILVVLYLRGGFDGLSALAPISDSEYYAKRPNIAVPAASGLAINSDWALHPALTQIKAMHTAGRAAFVPAVGASFVDRSHFNAQALTEIATGSTTSFSSGWLARYLSATAGTVESPLRSFGSGAVVPDSLTGSFSPSTASLSSLSLQVGGNFAGDAASVTRTLNKVYRSVSNPLLKAQALSAINAINTVGSTLATAVPPKNLSTGLGASLFQIAKLINSGFPVEIATADLANFDFHAAMGSATNPKGGQYALFAQMDAAIGAFFAYLGTNASRVTLVTMSEFGRRIAENSSGGSDHGHATTMMVLGGGVSSGVKGIWPGLTNTIDGDVIVANDYRTVLGEVVAKRLRPVNLGTVFPNFTMPSYIGVMA